MGWLDSAHQCKPGRTRIGLPGRKPPQVELNCPSATQSCESVYLAESMLELRNGN